MSIIIPEGAKTAPMPKMEDLPEADLAALADKVDDAEIFPEVRTAFAVIIGLDGQISLDPALVKNVRIRRAPHNDDVLGAIAALKSDVETTLSAMKTAQIMQQQAMAMQEQMREQAMTQRVQQALAGGKR